MMTVMVKLHMLDQTASQ